MGMILEPTPAMGEYGVEVRRESFYLRSEPGEDGRHGIIVYPASAEPVATGTAEILLEDIPKVRACLDAIDRYLGNRPPETRLAVAFSSVEIALCRQAQALREVLSQVTDRLENRLAMTRGDDEVIRAARELLKEE